MRGFDLDPVRWALPPPSPVGAAHHHTHLLSRRTFIGSMAGAAGVAAGAGLFPAAALAAKPANSAPKPTSQKVTINGLTFSLAFFGPGVDPSSIGDFNGFVGVADVQGTGTATNPDGSTETLLFDTDMRLMNGVYVGQDGAVHKGTFGFV